MFPFGGVPPLVGLPSAQLLPPALPIHVVSLPQPHQLHILPQHYQLAAQVALQQHLVQHQQLSLPPQLILRPQLSQPPLLLQRPLQHKVQLPVKSSVLGAPCTLKIPNTRSIAAPLDKKTLTKDKDLEDIAEAKSNLSVARTSVSQEPSERGGEVIVKQESDLKTEADFILAEEGNVLNEGCEKFDSGVKPTTEDPANTLCSDIANPKIRKMKHVMILDEERNFFMELPLENDNTLPLKLLQKHFPGVCGLTYRSLQCPHRQWIALDGGKLLSPKGGWEHDLYFCVLSKQSGGKWLHTFCHCSLSKPSRNKQTKSPTKFVSGRSKPIKNRTSEGSDKNIQCDEPEVRILENSKGRDRLTCPEIVVCSLPQWVNDKLLRKHCSRFGKVLAATVKKDLVGGHYGQVRFQDSSSQEKALAEVFHRFGDTWCSVRPQS